MGKYKLVLEDIGKFKNCIFDLSDATVFYGPNEAGKTTIIDALIHCLASYNKKQAIYTQILSPRYDGVINCKLKHTVNNEEVSKIDHDLVKNLLVVRASSLDLEFVQKSVESSWVEDVRNKLFTGGVNPQYIIECISQMEKKTQKSGSPLFECKKVEEDISDLKRDLENTKSEIRSHASTIKKQADLSLNEIKLQNDHNAITANLTGKEKELTHKKKILERQEIIAVQAKVSEQTRLKDKISKNSNYTEDTYIQLKDDKEKVKSLASQRDTYQQELVKKEKTHESSKQEFDNYEAGLEKINAHYDLAVKTQTKLEEMVSNNETKKAHRPTGLFVVAILLLIAGIVILMAIQSPLNFSGLILVLAAAAALWKATFGQKKEDSQLDLRAEIRIFNRLYKEQPSCPDNSYVAAIEFLRRLIDTSNESKNNLQSLKDKVKADKVEEDRIKIILKDLGGQFSSKDEAFKASLPHGVTSLDEYHKLVQEAMADKNRLRTIEEELISSAAKLGHNTIPELIQYLEHKIIEINNSPMQDEHVSQKDVLLLEQEIANLSKEKDQINTDLGKVGKDLSGTNVQIQLELNRLSEKQVKLQKEIKALETRRDELLLQMNSLRFIKELVGEIAEDSSEKFAVLSDSINKYMSVILDKKRQITFKAMDDMENIQCVDHYGKNVEATQLSSGTRDAFVLSARLALLEKVNLPKDAFLILDDPFVLMDKQRQGKAIKAIKQFHDEHKLPVVFFTKDDSLKDQIKVEFAEAGLVELTK